MTRSRCRAWAGSPPGPTLKGIPSASGRQTQPRRKREPLDRPGISGLEERCDVALLLLTCRRQLLRHQVVVYRPVDFSEDPDRSGVCSGLSQATERERRARLGVMGVVHEQLCLISNVDDLDAAVCTLPDASLVLFTEPDRLPVLKVDPVRLVLANKIEGTVVVDVAV